MLGHALDQLETEILYEADYIAEEIAKPSGQRISRAVIGEPTERLAGLPRQAPRSRPDFAPCSA